MLSTGDSTCRKKPPLLGLGEQVEEDGVIEPRSLDREPVERKLRPLC